MGNNIGETHLRWIGQGLDEACILSSLRGLPNPAMVSLANESPMLFPTWLVAQIHDSHPSLFRCFNFRLPHATIFCNHLENSLQKDSIRRTDGPSCKLYPSQTMLDGRTFRMQALFKGVSTRFGLQIVEKCFEKQFGNVRTAFQNRRLGTQWGA